MPLFEALFLSEIIKKPIFDPKGVGIGLIKDGIVIKGDPLPKLSALIVAKKDQFHLVKWGEINIFNKKIISTLCKHESLGTVYIQRERSSSSERYPR